MQVKIQSRNTNAFLILILNNSSYNQVNNIREILKWVTSTCIDRLCYIFISKTHQVVFCVRG
jgi:hypothetical protein